MDFRCVLVVIVPLLIAGQTAAQEQFAGSYQRTVLDCRGGSIEIVGGANNLSIRGLCDQVRVEGHGNGLVVESVRSIEFAGSGNILVWLAEVEGAAPQVVGLELKNLVVRANAPREAGVTGAEPADDELLFDNEQRVLQCGAGPVAVLGSGNQLTLRGPCPRLRIAGSDNLVLVDNPGQIVVTGDRNEVSWRSERLPEVSNTGEGNSIGPVRP